MKTTGNEAMLSTFYPGVGHLWCVMFEGVWINELEKGVGEYKANMRIPVSQSGQDLTLCTLVTPPFLVHISSHSTSPWASSIL